MTVLRAGVIGVGHLGQHHARLYATLPDVTLVGVVDQNRERAELIASRYGATVFERVADLLPLVDVVSVAVPTLAHYSVARACLEAGKHVLVEKPLAAQLAEAEELVELARLRGCVLQVGHSERFNPIMQMMRPHIRQPAFIEGHRIGPYSERGTDVDVVLDLMIHDLDLVLSFQPGSVEEIRAAGVPVLSPTIDIANARIQFRSGCVANLTASRVSLAKMRRLRVFQRDSYVSVDFQARQGIVGRRTVKAGNPVGLTIEEYKGSEEEPLKVQLESFVRSVRTGTPPAVSGEEGVAAVALAHQILAAIASFIQRWVDGEASMGRGTEGPAIV
ncbi:MAG: Gfo/Idh/MocA family oxidoreductase [Nitrospira sp.]|nr:Gfo/Idh/MocA family oxidoreductase [Nitrospira sp.]